MLREYLNHSEHTAGNEFRWATRDLRLTWKFRRHASISTTSDQYMLATQDEPIAAKRIAGNQWRSS